MKNFQVSDLMDLEVEEMMNSDGGRILPDIKEIIEGIIDLLLA